ncbi:Ig-like domain-containing protein [Mycoplasmatota bacterium]|nr:Ig-like domain-containing protein [Mycoplasmatota bacterium]
MLRTLLVIFSLFFLTACKDNIFGPVEVTGVSIKEMSTKLEIVIDWDEGYVTTSKVYVDVYPSNADNKKVFYTSSNEDVAKITEEGVIHPERPGTTEIVVTTEDGGFSDSIEIAVETVYKNNAPIIEGTSDFVITVGSDLPDFLDGVSVWDDLDPNLIESLEVDSSLVDVNTVGKYIVIYKVVDSGNLGNRKVVTVTVKEAGID